jgi:YbbR domain-containing protein
MSNTVRRLLGGLGSFVLALLLAVTVWIVARMETDPFSQRTFTSVPITILNQPDDTILIEPLVEWVAVTTRAPESILLELRPSDFLATMDLTGIEPGTPAIVPVEVTSSNEAVRIGDWEPADQNVYLEAVGTLTLPVSIGVEGEVATGYQAGRLTVSADQVTISGQQAQLAKVAAMIGSVVVAGVREDLVEVVPVRPVDAGGDLVPGLEWAPKEVQVQVSVSRKLGYKPEVEVVPDLRGEPAPGYRLGSVTTEPSTVTLAGVPSVLEVLPGFVETYPISVTNATANLLELSPLTVPNSVVVVGVDFVTVTVEVLPIESSRAISSSVEIRGVRPERTASASPNVVNVILEGPDAILVDMTPDDLRVIVDVFGLGLGVHRVAPEVLAPEGVAVVNIIPETIEVVLAPTPTPGPTLTVTGTVTPTLTVQP